MKIFNMEIALIGFIIGSGVPLSLGIAWLIMGSMELFIEASKIAVLFGILGFTIGGFLGRFIFRENADAHKGEGQ